MTPESHDDPFDRVRDEIRAEASHARTRVTLPERLPLTVVAARQESASIATLAALSGPAFVDHAFRTILRRDPDSEGFERQMAMLGAGASKVELLGDLRFSGEGRRIGVAIPGLYPRYLLAKATRVPVLGLLLQYVMAAISLPHLVRLSRVNEASLAVRFGEHDRALQSALQTGDDLRGALDAVRDDLASAVTELSDRLAREEHAGHAARLFIESTSASVADLRQLSLAMNHWATEVRRSVAAIDGAENQRRARDDDAIATLVRDARAQDPTRAARIATQLDAIAPHLGSGAKVLDLGGATDVLDAMAARGWRASAIESNAALHREAREMKLDVTHADAATLLPRIADGSLDALVVSARRVLDPMTDAEWLREALRVVKPGGAVLIAIDDGAMPLDALARATGFADVRRIDGALVAMRA